MARQRIDWQQMVGESVVLEATYVRHSPVANRLLLENVYHHRRGDLFRDHVWIHSNYLAGVRLHRGRRIIIRAVVGCYGDRAGRVKYKLLGVRLIRKI